jgi:hypothetical protein
MLTRAQKIGFLWFVTVWSVRFDKMCMDVWICDGCVYIYIVEGGTYSNSFHWESKISFLFTGSLQYHEEQSRILI